MEQTGHLPQADMEQNENLLQVDMEQNGLLPQVDMDQNGIIRRVRVFALDMDGTVYLGENWIDGAETFLETIREAGKEYIFLTNNSSRGPQNYIDKLSRMGLQATPDQIVTSGQAMVWYLKKNYPGARVYLMGNELLQKEFEEDGIILEDEHPDVAVLGFDTSLTYQKLCKMCDFVRAGMPYLATHPDFNCPTADGFIPDAGAMMELIRASAFRMPDHVVGKPNRDIADYLMERVQVRLPDLQREEIIMIGDRLYTDIAAGTVAGMRTALVLSGEATLENAAESAKAGNIPPDLIFSSVREMIPLI